MLALSASMYRLCIDRPDGYLYLICGCFRDQFEEMFINQLINVIYYLHSAIVLASCCQKGQMHNIVTFHATRSGLQDLYSDKDESAGTVLSLISELLCRSHDALLFVICSIYSLYQCLFTFSYPKRSFTSSSQLLPLCNKELQWLHWF